MPHTAPVSMPRLGFGLAAAALVLLNGCAAIEKAWPFGETAAAPHSTFTALETDPTVWCYRTLAAPDCYATEQPQFAGRLLGAFIRTAPPIDAETAAVPEAAAMAATP